MRFPYPYHEGRKKRGKGEGEKKDEGMPQHVVFPPPLWGGGGGKIETNLLNFVGVNETKEE